MLLDDSKIDVNVTLGRWPTRRMPLDEPRKLVAKLIEHGVVEAWPGSYDGLFQDDLSAVNDRLAAECKTHRDVRLVPFGEINPVLANWEAELTRCVEQHRMPGVRLHPNYHGYKLDQPEFARLLKLTAERKLLVQLVANMEDERMMHPLMRVPPVDLAPLPALVSQTPGLRLILLNALRSPHDEALARLLNMDGVYAEIAMLESAGAVGQLIVEVPPERVLFGSHAPSFYFESAVLKLRESQLPVPHLRAIANETARRLLPAN